MTTTTTFVTPKAPQLKENEWGCWDLSFFSFVGRDTMDFLNVECPVIDQAKLDTLRAAGKENVIRTYEKEFETKKKEWQSKQNLIHKYLVEACASDDAARLVAMEHKTKGPAEFYKKLEKRFRDTSKQSLTFQMSIFGQMSCAAHESRIEWVDRLSRQILMLLDLGATIPDEMRIERLLNGLHGHKTYSHEANILQLIPHTWESLVSQLRSWDIQESNKKITEKANLVSSIICHLCRKPGHKAPDCHLRINSQNNGNMSRKQYWQRSQNNSRNGKGNGGRGGGKGNGGGKGGKSGGGRGMQHSRNSSSYGNGGKGNIRTAQHITCKLCDKTGHYLSDCPQLKDAQTFIKRKKPDANVGVEFDSDEEFGMMLSGSGSNKSSRM
jgi:uncharacterized membrane protein YgcG